MISMTKRITARQLTSDKPTFSVAGLRLEQAKWNF